MTNPNPPTPATPWDNPPERKKTLRRKRAEKLARRAEHWGARLAEARAEGSDMEASVLFDRLRGEFDRLPETARERAYEDVVQALERLRETHAQ
ncbi:hypothetical protein [Streptomyces sp. NPDC088707]|uniref:hypothetical protein n=1 Tax=Streptomyces sp. NPDC088707 TaxID=3365871 RepID=UPI003816F3DA